MLYHRSRSRWVQAAFAVNGLLAASIFLPSSNWLMVIASLLWLALLEVLQIVVCWWSWRAWREGQTEALPLLVGTVLGNALLTVTMLPVFESYWWQGVGLWNFALAVFLMGGMTALVLRFVRLRRRLQWVSSQTLQAHEEERKRLARELHDGVAQSLLAIQLNLEMMRARLQQGRALDGDSLDQLVDVAKATSDELRRVARDLRPEALERMTLGEALQWLTSQFQSRTSLNVKFVGSPSIDCPPMTKDHIYRICQEALKNVVTHAHASEVVVSLHRRESLLEIVISDNGHGF